MTLPKTPPDAETFEQMMKHLDSINDEPRATILITHLYIEYLLDWIIIKKIAKPDKILKRTFSSKLELIESFNVLFDSLMHDLWVVNKIRNQFAHNIDIKSPDFEREFTENLGNMEYYKNNPSYKGVSVYNAHYIVMMQIYTILKNQLDSITPETEHREK
jgi:hypothetical protein